MLKLIQSDFNVSDDEPQVRVLDKNLTGSLIKEAADPRIDEFVDTMDKDPSKMYLHIIALSSGEVVGSNANGDYFPEQNLVDCHDSFTTSPAHVFKNHVNRDSGIALGQVIYSMFNPRMHRVELIAWIDRNKARDVVERIEKGDLVRTSMACKTAWDTCSICNNKATTRQEYCTHLRTELGRIYPDGRRVMALNDAPLRFFDISIVVRGADPTSSVLQKVASHNHGAPIIGSAEAAEDAGLVEKAATHKKLSEFVKTLDGEVAQIDDDLEPLLAKIQDPDRSVFQHLSHYSLGEVLDTFASMGISPSLAFLGDMIGHRMAGEAGVGIGPLLEGYLAEHGHSELPLADVGIGEDKPNRRIADALSPFVKQASVYPYYVAQRSYDSPDYIPGTGRGYIGNGPHVEPSPREVYQAAQASVHSEETPGLLSMLSTLLKVGGAALAAKWYITRMIEKKMSELENSQNFPRSGANIAMVKSAQDAKLSAKLAKMSLVKCLSPSGR